MNLRVNEVLCFMKNKKDIFPFDILKQLCVEFYSDEDVLKAKELLYATAFLHLHENERPRRIDRRGAAKRQSDVEDMLRVLLAAEAEHTPTFVAADLSQLPPVGPRCFDLSRILRDVDVLKQQMIVMQEAQRVNLAAHSALCAKTADIPAESPELTEAAQEQPNKIISVESRDSASALNPASISSTETMQKVPTTLSQESDIDSSDERLTSDDEKQSSLNNLFRLPKRNWTKIMQRKQQANATNHQVGISYKQRAMTRNDQQRPSASGAANKPSGQSSGRRQNDDAISGRGQGFALKAATKSAVRVDRPKVRQTTGIFVTRLARSTQPSQLVKHVRLQTGVECQCEALITRHDSYRSFCIRCPAKVRQMLLSPDAWPKGALVREYED